MSATLECSVSILLMIIGCAAAAMGVYRWSTRAPRRYCPGQRGSRWRLLWPIRWFWIHPCGYDLSHHSPDAAGTVTCPECGGRIRRERMLARIGRLRLAAMAVACLMTATGMMLAGLARSGSLMPMIPATALIAAENALGERTPREVRRELRARIDTDGLFDWQTRAAIDLLIRDLRHDARRWNALKAQTQLCRLGALADTALLRALEADDPQQRQFAASVLQSRSDLAPPESLLRVSVEGLRQDRRIPDLYNALRSVRYLLSRVHAAEEQLVRGLRGGDAQQRLLCAYIIGAAGLTARADEAAPILVEHLRSNTISRDGMWALVALARLGRSALPHLLEQAASDDLQQRTAVTYLIALAEHDGRGPRPRMPPGITNRFDDPLAVDPGWLPLPRFRKQGVPGASTSPQEVSVEATDL
jgi:hypothetical protein